MTVDPINKIDKLFPDYMGDNENLVALLARTSQILIKWLADSKNIGPLPIVDNHKCSMPEEKGSSSEILFSEIESLIYSSFNPSHPGSLAHLDPPPLLISIIGDVIAASLNNNLLANELSPSISLLEESICQWISNKLGFNDLAGGIAASGGTLSNLNALVAARFSAGLESDANAVFIASEDAHSSFKKCARIMGLSAENFIKVKTDSHGSMDLTDLSNIVDKCSQEGKNIFSIVATFGTTIRGAVDPIEDISNFCRDRKIWLHIDGSIGGIFGLTDIFIKGVNYICKSNSVTINPQKILGITKTSSLLIVSDRKVLKNAFSTGLPYIASNNNTIDRGELGIQGSRPAEIIKLWLGLRFLGMIGIEEILGSSIQRKNYFERNLNKDKYDIYSGPLHIVTFLPRDINKLESDLWTLKMRKNLMNYYFMLSRPMYRNKFYLRAVLGNYNTNKKHLDELLKLLNLVK